MEAPIIRVVTQRHGNDCSVACLAMLLGVSYENALVAIAQDEPDVCMNGVWARHLYRAAKRLGYRLTRKRVVDLETDTGLLRVFNKKLSHLVVLKQGLIFDTDACVYDADVYVSTYKVRFGSLYVAEAA